MASVEMVAPPDMTYPVVVPPDTSTGPAPPEPFCGMLLPGALVGCAPVKALENGAT